MLIFFRRKKDALLAESNPLFFPAAESFLCLFRINRLSVCAEYVVTPAAGRFDRALRRKRVPWDVIHVVPHTVYRVERVFTALLPNKIAHTVFIVALLYQWAFIVNIVLEPERFSLTALDGSDRSGFPVYNDRISRAGECAAWETAAPSGAE